MAAKSRVAGITIEFDGDFKKLKDGLKSVDTDLRNTQDNLKDVNKLLKMDPGNTELLNQKYKDLTGSIDSTKSRLNVLKDAEAQMAAKGLQGTEDWDKLQREIVETEQKLKSLTKEMENFGSVTAQKVAAAGQKVSEVGTKMESAGKSIMPVSTAVLGIGAAAVKTTADFDSQMSKVKAIAGDVSEDAIPEIIAKAKEMGLQFKEGSNSTETAFNILRAKAREMGAETKFSASEAGSAFEYMAMAGWKTSDMLGGIEGIMHLAAASGEDLGRTSDIVTDALTAFNMTADQSGHFADILAAASSNANTNVSMMGETFKYIAPVAGSLGYSAEDTALAIGLIANSGIKASQAGTSLRRIISNLASPTDSVAYGMQKLGISMTDSTGKVKPLRELMDDLRQSFNNGNMSQELFQKKLEQINASLEKGDLEISEYAKEHNKLDEQLASGTISQEDYNAAIEELEFNLSHGVISDTGTYEMAINDLAVAMWGAEGAQKAELAAAIGGKNGMSALLAIVNASEEDYNKLAGAIDNCDGSAKKMADTMNDNLEGQLTILKSQLAELAISIGDIIMPVLREMVKGLQGIVDWLNHLSPATKEIIVKIGAVVAAAGPLLIMGGKVAQGIGSIMQLAPKLVTAFSKIPGILTTVGGAFKALWAFMLANPITIIIAAIAALVGGFIYLWNNCEEFREFWINLWENIKTAIETAWNAITQFLSTTWTNISTAATNAWNAISQFFSTTWTNITNWFHTALNNISMALSTAWTNITTGIQTAWNAIAAFITTTWENIKQIFSNALAAVGAAVSTAWSNISANVTTAMGNIKSFIIGAWDNIKSSIASALSNIASGITNGFNTAKNNVVNALNAIKSTASSIWDGIVNLVRGAVDRLKSLVSFKWELPKLKLPHFSISGSFSLNPPSVPSLSVDWYKKAMDNGMILDSPTIFGAMGGKLLGGGDAGAEAVVGVDSLRGMISDAVAAAAGIGGDITIPVYIGQQRLDTIVVKAMQRTNYKSGGR